MSLGNCKLKQDTTTHLLKGPKSGPLTQNAVEPANRNAKCTARDWGKGRRNE